MTSCGIGFGNGNKSHASPSSSDSGRKNLSSRPGPGPTSVAYSASTKRPNSTCSVSSTGSSSKSGCSRGNSKKSSSERLSELDGVSLSLGTSGLLDHTRHQTSMAHVSGIPRPGSAQSSSSSSSTVALEHKSKSCRGQTSLQTLQELYGLGSGETSFSHDSLGRRHKLQPSQYPYGSSTIPPPSKDYSTIISNPHASLSNRERALRSSASSSKGHHHHHHSHHQGGDSNGDHPSPYSVTFAMDTTGGSHSGGSSPYSSWLRRSPSNVSSVASLPVHRVPGSLTEAESLESLASNASSIHAQIQHARANSLTHACLALHQRHTSPSPRLARSNSIRSTKSEKLYPSMLQRSEDLDTYLGGPMSASVHTNPRNVSQPASPTPDGQVSG